MERPRDDASMQCVRCMQRTSRRRSKQIDTIFTPVLEYLVREIGVRPSESARICLPCLISVRARYTRQRSGDDVKALHADIVRKAADYTAIADSIEREFREESTWTDWATDLATRTVGSWVVVATFWSLLAGSLLVQGAYGTVPVITVMFVPAALLLGVLTVSMTRIARRQQRRDERDLRIGLKLETEVDGLHEKIDHLMEEQYARLLELQKVQIDLLQGDASRPRDADMPRRP